MIERKTEMNLIKITSIVILLACLASSTAFASPQQNTTPDFAAIDSYIEAQMKELRIPGLALGIVQGDQIIHLKGFGIADPSGRAVTPQTPFQIASLGKPMTGVAIMQLVEQGKLELDAPVQRYLPWFRVADEAASAQITVRHLLYHTSGLPQTVDFPYALRGDNRPDALEARVRELRTVQLNRPVGASYEYSNTDYITLGLLIQQVSGQSYADYMTEHVFTPLQMQRAFTELDEAKANGLATGYRYWFGVPLPGEMALDRAILPAGGSMSASVEDMTHFLIANLNGGRFGDASMLSPASIAEMQRGVAPKDAQISTGEVLYAMDWAVEQIGGVGVVTKGGDLPDFKTNMVLIPGRGLGVVVLMNTNGGGGFAGLFGDIRIALLPLHIVELVLEQPPTVFPVNRIPSIMYGVLLVIVVIQLGGMMLTLVRIQRWQSGRSRPHSQGAKVLQIGLPLVLNLAWGLLALVGIARFLGAPLSIMQYLVPSFGYTLLVSGVVALGWAVVRTVLVYFALRGASTNESSAFQVREAAFRTNK
jgi:CubicO group peptidase (beta-lactamase class C family)